MGVDREIPKGWSTAKLSSVCEKITDGSHFSPRSVDIGFPYVTVRDLKNDTIDFSKCLKICRIRVFNGYTQHLVVLIG
jgi:type I restriction enzyme S subunit